MILNRSIFAAVVLALCVVARAQVRSPAPKTEQPTLGTIDGKVVNESGQPLAGAMVVWTVSGISSVPICMTGITADTSFHCDMPFSAFSGTPEWEHVQYIAIVLESAGSIFSHDYAINSISAVREPEAPAGLHPSAAPSPLRSRPVATPSIPRRGR